MKKPIPCRKWAFVLGLKQLLSVHQFCGSQCAVRQFYFCEIHALRGIEVGLQNSAVLVRCKYGHEFPADVEHMNFFNILRRFHGQSLVLHVREHTC